VPLRVYWTQPRTAIDPRFWGLAVLNPYDRCNFPKKHI
jgi:hypothetical protein